MEQGPAAAIWRAPQHEYTRRLIASAPTLKSPPLVSAWSPAIPRARPYLLEAIKLRKEYVSRSRLLGKPEVMVAVADSNFTIERGQTVAVVGESGSGKSTTARMLLRLEAPTRGDVVFDGRQVTDLTGRDLRAFRRRVQPVFQNAVGSLDARFTIRQCVEEPLILHDLGTPRERARRVDQLLEKVGLSPALADRRPAEISGGQAQRVAIARALALSPDLIVLDEAVSALDVIVQRQILDLLVALQRDSGIAYLFISHDLAVVRMIAHHALVMKDGVIVEAGAPGELFARPAHPYTRLLVGARPGEHAPTA